MDTLVKKINNDPFGELEKISEKQLEEVLLLAQDKFFNSDSPIFPDEIYDILIDYLKFKFPKNKISKNIGAKIKS